MACYIYFFLPKNKRPSFICLSVGSGLIWRGPFASAERKLINILDHSSRHQQHHPVCARPSPTVVAASFFTSRARYQNHLRTEEVRRYLFSGLSPTMQPWLPLSSFQDTPKWLMDVFNGCFYAFEKYFIDSLECCRYLTHFAIYKPASFCTRAHLCITATFFRGLTLIYAAKKYINVYINFHNTYNIKINVLKAITFQIVEFI